MRPELALLVACALPPQSPTPPPRMRIVVGSKNFTESRLLGEIITRLLAESGHWEVRHRSGLGGTMFCFEALASGQIDLYPEYTGTAWSVVLKEPRRVRDPLEAFAHVQAQYRRRFDLEWLQPLGPNNTYALAVRAADAEEWGIRTISGLMRRAPELRAGFSVEFMNREDGFPGLSACYGLDFGVVRAIEHGLAYEAIEAGEVDVIDAYSTDGKLPRFALRVLEDDRGFFPPYDAAVVVRGALLRADPRIRDALEHLAFRLPDARMRELNRRVEEGEAEFAEVARGWLAEEGLIGERPEGAAASSRPGEEGFLGFFLGRWRTTLGLLWEHVVLTLVSVAAAALLAIPLGIWLARHALAERLALASAGVLQTIPSLALLAFMIAIPGLGLSARSAVAALFLYALLPILRNTVTGLHDVDPELIAAARGLGLSARQILLRVQLPMATRTVMAGLRTATVINVGVATLAAFIGAGGLGQPIVTGLYLNDPRLVLAGALPAAGLALAADALLARLEVALTPPGLRLTP